MYQANKSNLQLRSSVIVSEAFDIELNLKRHLFDISWHISCRFLQNIIMSDPTHVDIFFDHHHYHSFLILDVVSENHEKLFIKLLFFYKEKIIYIKFKWNLGLEARAGCQKSWEIWYLSNFLSIIACGRYN